MKATANVRSRLEAKLREAFRDIIDGKTVKRSKHELSFSGIDVSDIFIHELIDKGFTPMTVGQADVRPGERMPAFFLQNDHAYFGWIFWEKFSEKKYRKLFGSVVRNRKGDWSVQIPSGSDMIVYAHPNQKFEMDIDRPYESIGV